MKFRPPVLFQEAFRLNAPTARQQRAVGFVWLIGAIVAATWATFLYEVPQHGAIAVTNVAAAPHPDITVAEADVPKP
jgi:hypothetical protein